MPFLAALLAVHAVPQSLPVVPPCRARQLRLSVDERDGAFNGMSHSGVELAIRNVGPDCTVPAVPVVQMLDARGRVLAAVRRPPIGMHPGPAMIPVTIAGGHRATIDLRWVSGPVFDRNRSVRANSVAVRIGVGTVRAPVQAVLYGEPGKPVMFDQTPVQKAGGTPTG